MAHWVAKEDNSSYKSVFWGSFFGFMLACLIVPYFGIVFGLIGVFSTRYSSSIKNNLNKKGVIFSLIPSLLLQCIWMIIIGNFFNKLKNLIIIIIFIFFLISLLIIIYYIKKNNIIPLEEDWKKYYFYKFNNIIARRNKSGLSYDYEFYINNEWCLNSNLGESLSKAIESSKKTYGVNKYLISYEEAKIFINKK